MSLWELSKDGIAPVARTSFQQSSIWERRDLQRLLRDQIDVLGDDLMVVAEEFSNWVHSDLRVDLLCIDRAADLVVIELKRDDNGGHAELQAIRYASMVEPATFEHIVEAHRAYSARRHRESAEHPEFDAGEARQAVLDFLGWDEPDDEAFGSDVRIILAATDFSITLTSAVLWLRKRGNIDIRCVRLVPYALDSESGQRLLVDVQQLVPLPETADFTDRMADKEERKREARTTAGARDNRRFNLVVAGRSYSRLPKRRFAYEVARAALLDCDVPPESILERTEQGKRRGKRLLVRLPARMESADVRAFLAQTGRDPRRFFIDDADLLTLGDDMWMFTNQWGEGTEEFVDELATQHPGLAVTYSVAED
ncbi:MAG: hypothetical protein O3B31_07335 [Chloroflexi bacterium]|nr:hypothetical protein [Chloroflexota bacterium]